jgi:hypothetical protein
VRLRVVGRLRRSSVNPVDELPLFEHRDLEGARVEWHLADGMTVEILVDNQERRLRWTVHDRRTNQQLSGGQLDLGG